MIKAVLFDIGGVLIRTTDLEPRRKWERQFGLRDWELQDIFFNSETGQLAQIGHARVADAWAHVQDRLKLTDAQLREIQKDFFAGDTLDGEVWAIVQALKPRYALGIISNAMADGRQIAGSYFDLSLFDAVLFSAEEGTKKPGREIYLRALARLKVPTEEAVFIDDSTVNISAAHDMGIHAIHYTPDMNAGNLKAALKQLGVKP